ncbi:hypothetical protein A2U01_0068072 [Trifolium medium]|uniref:Uncharacterized protein n=1 Tax=Trifolium medium TaxID=97028 RepID=A0A392SD39_9FABA|nr:hypothetical protein [Trifolium medium]
MLYFSHTFRAFVLFEFFAVDLDLGRGSGLVFGSATGSFSSDGSSSIRVVHDLSSGVFVLRRV